MDYNTREKHKETVYMHHYYMDFPDEEDEEEADDVSDYVKSKYQPDPRAESRRERALQWAEDDFYARRKEKEAEQANNESGVVKGKERHAYE